MGYPWLPLKLAVVSPLLAPITDLNIEQEKTFPCPLSPNLAVYG